MVFFCDFEKLHFLNPISEMLFSNHEKWTGLSARVKCIPNSYVCLIFHIDCRYHAIISWIELVFSSILL